MTRFLRVSVLGHNVRVGSLGGGVEHDHVGGLPLADAPGTYVFDN